MIALAEGFEVYDLEVDAPYEAIVDKAREIKPDIIGLSGLISTLIDSMTEII